MRYLKEGANGGNISSSVKKMFDNSVYFEDGCYSEWTVPANINKIYLTGQAAGGLQQLTYTLPLVAAAGAIWMGKSKNNQYCYFLLGGMNNRVYQLDLVSGGASFINKVGFSAPGGYSKDTTPYVCNNGDIVHSGKRYTRKSLFNSYEFDISNNGYRSVLNEDETKVVGTEGDNKLLTNNPNTTHLKQEIASFNYIRRVFYLNGYFIAACDDATNKTRLYICPETADISNSANWSFVTVDGTNQREIQSINWTGTNYVIYAISGTTGYFYYSTTLNGSYTVSASTMTGVASFSSMEANGSNMVMVGTYTGSASRSSYSTDHGVTWGTYSPIASHGGTGHNIIPNSLHYNTKYSKWYVAISSSTAGSTGTVYYSTDGQTWTATAASMGTGGNCSAACVSSPTGNIFSVLSNGTTTNIFSLVGTTTDQNIYGGSSSISTFYNGDSRDKLPLIIRNKTKSKNYLSLLRGASNTTISTDGGSNPGSGSTGANYHPTGTGGNGNSDISPSSYKSVVGIPATNAFKVGANSILFEDIIGTSLESKVLPGAGGNYKTANNPVATGGGSIFSLQGNYISSIPPAGVGASGILGVNANHYHATGSGAAIVRFPIDVAPGDVISITLGYAASLNIDTATDPTVLNGPAAALIEWDDPS